MEVVFHTFGGFPHTRKASRKKVQTSKLGLHLLLMANILRQLVANLILTYQAARSMTPVG